MGSVFLLDEDRGCYCRMPKHEGPRLSPPGEDWGGEGAGILEDLRWHPMERWEIVEKPLYTYKPTWDLEGEISIEQIPAGTQLLLVIHIPDSEEVVVAPDAVVLEN